MNNAVNSKVFHIIFERDVGLFSLFQQVIAQIPWAITEKRIPIIYFHDGCAYWTPNGYRDKDTVWEYYFEPVCSEYPAAYLTNDIREKINKYCISENKNKLGDFIAEDIWVSNHFGDASELKGKTLAIPYQLYDPEQEVRENAYDIINKYIRPRSYILNKVEDFYDRYLKTGFIIGVHIRGTDSVSNREKRNFRKNSLNLALFYKSIKKVLIKNPEAKIFVATDDESSLDYIKNKFGEKVNSYDSIRHLQGEKAGEGPLGKIMPAYISGNRDIAARNGEEAVIEYLLLTKCSILIHNGASLARTVLLSCPFIEHINTNPNKKFISRLTLAIGHSVEQIVSKIKKLKINLYSFKKKELMKLRKNIKNTIKYVNNSKKNINKKIKKYIKDRNKQIEKRRRQKENERRADYNMVQIVKSRKDDLKKLGSHKDKPNISILILSFNHKENVKNIIDNLRLTEADEIIVCEDGSIDGALEEWLKYLNNPNDFLIRSNDIHEIRAYDRAIHLARGEYVCILQDDDIPPTDSIWITVPLKLFDLYPKLAVIGGFQGRIFGNNKIRYGTKHSEDYTYCPFIEPNLKVPFVFVHAVNVGPIFIRKNIYHNTGGFDYHFSKPGESGIHFDYDMCLRTWLNGYQVGLYTPDFVRHVGVQGTSVYGLKEREQNDVKNMQYMKDSYWSKIDDIKLRIDELNASLLSVNNKNKLNSN